MKGNDMTKPLFWIAVIKNVHYADFNPSVDAENHDYTGTVSELWMGDTLMANHFEKDECNHNWVEGVDENGKLIEPAQDVCINCGEISR